MNRKPREPKTETVFTFVPAPQPKYAFDKLYTVAGVQVHIKRMEWMAHIRQWIYYLDTKIMRVISVINETEFTALNMQQAEAA